MPARSLRSAILALLLPATVLAQGNGEYEARYGPPVDVSLSDLVDNAMSYVDRAVRTTGTLELSQQAGGGRGYVLRDTLTRSVRLEPVPELRGVLEMEGMEWLGRRVQVVGVASESRSNTSGMMATEERLVLYFWRIDGPDERDDRKKAEARTATLESLVENPGRRDGQVLRLVGKFRGKNLYGDLPARSQRDSDDWVIKDDLYAVWVTGKKPKGRGWELDTDLKRDTGKWIEVIGRPVTMNGITYVKAIEVNLTTPPTPVAEAKPAPPPPPRPKVPPVVVFALPLDGEDVPPASQFVVQFSKDMDESTFKGRVVLRYVGPRQPGDRALDGVKLRYDGGRRALTVDPGDLLRPGRQVELLLLPGIADLDGLPLVPRQGDAGEHADVLRYVVNQPLG